MNSENLIENIKRDIEKHKLFDKGSSIVVGVSGGADSVCLLKVLKKLQDDFDLKITAVHVNHGLREEESDQDQSFVEDLCSKWGIALKTFKVDIKALACEKKISQEEAGREARYKLFYQVLDEIGADYIAVAHQKEDQAETVMLNILRGTGLDGLCGMSIKQGRLIRPLLNISREQILQFLNKYEISYRIDSTNLKSDYTRNRIRNNLFPLLREMFGVNPVTQLARLSCIAREERDHLETFAKKAYDSVVINDADDVEISLEKFNGFSQAIKRRIIRIAWEKINRNRKNLEYLHVEQILDLCQKGITGKRIILPKGFEVRLSYGRLIFSRSKDSAFGHYCYSVTLNGITRAEEANGILCSQILDAEEAFRLYGTPEDIKERNQIQLFDYNKLKGEIVLRTRNEGDRIYPYGSRGEKKLKKFFIDEKIPREKRNKIPVVAQGNKIVWIIGMRTSEEFRARKDSQKILVFSWNDLLYDGD